MRLSSPPVLSVWRSVLATVLRSDCKQVLRFDNELPGSRAWIAGKPVKNGDRVAFEDGSNRMLIEVTVDKIPPDGLWLSRRFWPSDDPAEEERTWLAFAKRTKPYLENVIKLAPESVEAAETRRVLAGAGEH